MIHLYFHLALLVPFNAPLLKSLKMKKTSNTPSETILDAGASLSVNVRIPQILDTYEGIISA